MSEPSSQLYFIIGGAGQVGYFLAKALLDAGHEVTLLDKDARRVDDLEREFSEAVVVRGDACEVRTLDRVGCARADYLLAVTGDDEDNLVMCQVANARFNMNRTVARVNNMDNIQLFKDLGISVVISPTQSILDVIQTELPLKTIVKVTNATKATAQLVEITVPAHSRIDGQPLRNLRLPKGNAIVLVIRNDESFAPADDTRIAASDKLFAVVTPEGKQSLKQLVLSEEHVG